MQRTIKLGLALTFAALLQPLAAEFYSLPWTGDDDAGVTAENIVWAYNFGTSASATINGVTFTGVDGPTPSVEGRFVVTMVNHVQSADTNNLTSGGGGSAVLAKDFIGGGLALKSVAPEIITLSGLKVGEVYSLHVYCVGRAVPTPVIWRSDTESATFDEDGFGDNNGRRITHVFSARASTRTITIEPRIKLHGRWAIYGIALTSGPTFVPITPVPTLSSAVDPAYPLANAVDGSANEFRSTAGAATFIEFDFGRTSTVDGFVNVTTTETKEGSCIKKSRLIFDTDGTAGFTVASDTVVTFTEDNTGWNGTGWINRFPPVTAQKARWEAVELQGKSVVGTMEMVFLQSPIGSVNAPPGVVSEANLPPLSASFAKENAWNGIAGLGRERVQGPLHLFKKLFGKDPIEEVEYVASTKGQSISLTFDLGSDQAVTGFDFFDRIRSGNQVVGFELSFLDADSKVIQTKSYQKPSSWLKSDHFAPIFCRKIMVSTGLPKGEGSEETNAGVGELVIYRVNPSEGPAVTASAASAIGPESATVAGNVTAEGAFPVTERGIVYAKRSENSKPFVGGTGVVKVIQPGTTGAFTMDLTGLEAETAYVFSAYATNSNGTTYTYSNAEQFTTLVLKPLATGASTVGLWIGEVELNEVVPSAETPEEYRSTPAPFRYTLIMHVNSQGQARLLREATLMQTKDVPPQPVIITKTSTDLADYDGITSRGGKLVGQRFSATNFPPPEGGAVLKLHPKGIAASITMLASDPLNPFRHKYHPDLAAGREITNEIIFSPRPENSPDHQWSVEIYNFVTGVSNLPLQSRGIVTFTRVSELGKLDQP